jgi:hypothetical protein
MARPQFMKINGKAVCVVSTKGVRTKGKKQMQEEIAKRKSGQVHEKQKKADKE